MHVFGANSNHIQQNNVVNNHHQSHHHHGSHSNNRLQEGTNHINNGFANTQQPSRQQLPEKDYSNLINPRTLPKEIVASESIVNEEEADVHDTLDLSGQENFENSRARYYDKKI